MNDLCTHDQIIAKIQHFAEVIKRYQLDKELLLLTFDSGQSCNKDKVKDQIVVCEEILKEYYDIFDNILYR